MVVVRRLLPIILLALFGCVPGKRLDIELHNPGAVPLEVTASVGPFQKTVILMPFGSWSGWVPVLDGAKAKIMIQQKIFTPEAPTR